MNNKKILIFGGLGYIGTVVVNYFLKKNFKVIIVDNLIYNQKLYNFQKKRKNLKIIRSNISKIKNYYKLLDKKTNVVILSGLVGDPITKKYPAISKKINEKYTIDIIKTCQKKNINRIIFVSTCSNYGIKKNTIAKETSKLEPISLYAKSKVKIEKYIMKLKNNKSFCPTILRFATAFGVSKRMRFDLTLNEFVKEIELKNKLEIYDSQTFRPYCHIKDFAKIIHKTLILPKKKISFQVFNVGSDKNNYNKYQIINKIGKFVNINKVKFTDKSKDMRNYIVNFKKLRKFYGNIKFYSLEYGINEVLKFVRENRNYIKKAKKKEFGNYFINLNK